MTTEANSGKSKFEKAEQILEDFETSIGLPPNKMSISLLDEAQELLALSREDRERLTCEECAEAALTLSQYAAHISRACQREEQRMVFAEDESDRIIAPFITNISAYGKWEKRLSLLANNKEAQSFESMRKEAQAKYKRLLYFSQRVDKVADAYRNLSIIKKRG